MKFTPAESHFNGIKQTLGQAASLVLSWATCELDFVMVALQPLLLKPGRPARRRRLISLSSFIILMDLDRRRLAPL
jgi:hypothetical protein